MADSWGSLVKLEKITHPMMAYMLLPWYLGIWETEEKSCSRLYSKLANKPDDTFCCAETHDDIIKGVTLAYKDGDDLVIWQMNRMNPKVVELPIESWGRSRGCKRVVIYTDRSPRAFTRSYGFDLINTEIVDGKERHQMSRSL
jgi:hypothetical protein